MPELVSDWMTVTQERINQFAEATGDDQWIHVDVERARAESPYGATIAHGFLTLSLMATLLRRTSNVSSSSAVNYGLNRVRFIKPVIAGSRIRARFEQAATEGSKVTWKVTAETDAGICCVAEWIVLYNA